MKFIPSCLLLFLLVSSLSPVHGVLEGPYTNYKCQCLKSASFLPRPHKVVHIKTFPPGYGCPRAEIIVWLKNKSVLCLDPTLMESNPKWIKSVNRLLSSASVKQTQKMRRQSAR